MNSDAQVTVLADAPVASSVMEPEIGFKLQGSRLVVTFSYRVEGNEKTSSFVFDGVEAHALTSEAALDAWPFDAYDRLIEPVGSEWVNQVVESARRRGYVVDSLHHYVIYLDGLGWLEVLAEGWALV